MIYTESYFKSVIKRYFLHYTAKSNATIENPIKEKKEAKLLKVPFMTDMPVLLSEMFTFSEFDKSLIKTYELYTKLGYSLDDIIEMCLPIIEENKPIEPDSVEHQEVTPPPSIFEDMKPLFIEEEDFNAFEKEVIEMIFSKKMENEDVLIFINDLYHKYINEGKIDMEIISNQYFSEKDMEILAYAEIFQKKAQKGKNKFYTKNEYKDFLKVQTKRYLFQFKEDLKPYFKAFEKEASKLIDEYNRKIFSLTDNAEQMECSKILNTNIILLADKYKKLNQKNEKENTQKDMQRENKTTFKFYKGIYNFNFKKDLKRQCFKFFVNYEFMKMQRKKTFKGKRVEEKLDEAINEWEKLMKPSEPLISYEDLFPTEKEESPISNPTDIKIPLIKGKLSKAVIIEYFMQLTNFTTSKGNIIQVLTKEEVLHLVYANFEGFSEFRDRKKFDTPNIKQIELRRFVYKFYQLHSLETRTGAYIHFLMDNFSIFANNEFSSLQSNFNK